VTNALISAHSSNRPEILVPTLEGKRGHPVLFPWTLTGEVYSLSAAEGLNILRQRHENREIPCDAIEPTGAAAFSDVDTPQDYERLQ